MGPGVRLCLAAKLNLPNYRLQRNWNFDDESLVLMDIVGIRRLLAPMAGPLSAETNSRGP